MKKTKYYFTCEGIYRDSCDWTYICLEAAKQKIKLYKDKETGEMFSYQSMNDVTLYTGSHDWGITPLRSEEVDIDPKFTKLKPGKSRKTQWKSSNKGGNGKNVTLNPKSFNTAKKPGPVRYYNKVEQDGFTRLNKPKNNSPKGTIVGIITGA